MTTDKLFKYFTDEGLQEIMLDMLDEDIRRVVEANDVDRVLLEALHTVRAFYSGPHDEK